MGSRRVIALISGIVALILLIAGGIVWWAWRDGRPPSVAPSGAEVAGTVDGTGLVLRHPGGAELRVPAGALPAGTPVRLGAGRSDFLGQLGELQRDGRSWDVSAPVEPVAPVELVLPYDPELMPAGGLPLVVTFDELSGWWLPVPTTADPAARRLIARLPSFSAKTWITDRWAEAGDVIGWLDYQAGRLLGNRGSRADCADRPAPAWVDGVVTNPDANARTFACVSAEGGGFAIRLSSNRGYPLVLDFDVPYTRAVTSSLDDGLTGFLEKVYALFSGRVMLLPTGSGSVTYDPPPTARGIVKGTARRDAVALGIWLAMELLRQTGVDLPLRAGRTLGVWTLDCLARLTGSAEDASRGEVVSAVTGLGSCLQEALTTEVRAWGLGVPADLWSRDRVQRLPAPVRKAVGALRWLWAIDATRYAQTAVDLWFDEYGAAGDYTDVTVSWSRGSGPGQLDLRRVDWANATIPGDLCRSPRDITLVDGAARSVPSTFDGPTPNYPQDVLASVDQVRYGDVTGDGRDEAVLPVLCANHDSTAAGQRAFGLLVFTAAGSRPRVVGTLTGLQPRKGEPPNVLRVQRIGGGEVVATELFYGGNDANCCPSGEATDVWRYAGGRFDAGTSTVSKPPQ